MSKALICQFVVLLDKLEVTQYVEPQITGQTPVVG